MQNYGLVVTAVSVWLRGLTYQVIVSRTFLTKT